MDTSTHLLGRPFKMGDSDYKEIALNAMIPRACATKISAKLGSYLLNVMPPIYVPGGALVCEAITQCAMGNVHTMFGEYNGQWYAKNVVRGVHATYMTLSGIIVLGAFPGDPENDWKGYADDY